MIWTALVSSSRWDYSQKVYSQLEIEDIIHLDVQFLGDGLHQERVMLAGELGRCRCLRCGAAFGRNLFHFRFRGGRGRVELLGHETENGLRIRALCEWRSARSRARAYLEFGFLVELESIVDGAIKMDRCKRDASNLRLRGKTRATHPK